MKENSLTTELWREYDFGGRIYRIEQPVKLWVGETTHRVLDNNGIVHCLPKPGLCGCVLRWFAPDTPRFFLMAGGCKPYFHSPLYGGSPLAGGCVPPALRDPLHIMSTETVKCVTIIFR